MEKTKKKGDLNNLVRLQDYFKYLYEQENQRNEKLNSVTNTYLVVITFAFTFLVGLLGWISPNPNSLLISANNTNRVLWFVGVGISLILILVSLIFTMLVVKVRSFERLCSPIDFAAEASQIDKEDELISAIISHYVVATERNFILNNKKARFLAYGLQTYIVGFVLLLFTLTGIYITGR